MFDKGDGKRALTVCAEKMLKLKRRKQRAMTLFFYPVSSDAVVVDMHDEQNEAG